MTSKTQNRDRMFVDLAEKAPKRSIAANMTIFQAMAAERDGMPDVKTPADKESSDDMEMIVTTEENPDLKKMIDAHRGETQSPMLASPVLVPSSDANLTNAFVQSAQPESNFAWPHQEQTSAWPHHDLNMFEVVESPGIKSTVSSEETKARRKEPTKTRSYAFITGNDDDLQLFRRTTIVQMPSKTVDVAEKKAPQNSLQNDGFFNELDEKTAKLTQDRSMTTYKRLQTEAVVENESNQQIDADLLAASPSIVRADTERFKLFERAADGTNILANMEKRDAVVKKKESEIIEEIEDQKSYDSEDSLDLLDVGPAPFPQLKSTQSVNVARNQPVSEQKINDFVNELMNDNVRGPIDEVPIVKYDIFKLINKNEHLFIKYAEKKLVENKTYIMERATKLKKALSKENIATQRVLGGPMLMRSISQELTLLRSKTQSSATCCVITDEVILLGTSAGVLWAFERDTEKLWGKFFEDDKAFRGNAITCIDVHPIRTEYVIIGYQRGQMILLDLTDIAKAKKVIKDHHKDAAVVTVKFCDYVREREHTLSQQLLKAEMEKQGVPIEKIQQTIAEQEVTDKQVWMVASTDTVGRLIVTNIQKVAFGLCSSDKTRVIDPTRPELQEVDNISAQEDGSTLFYPVMDCRFYNKLYPQGFQNDSRSLIAIGSSRDVIIYQVDKEFWQRRFVIERPKMYYSENKQAIVSIAADPPCIAWGYGRTPCFKDRTYSLLAVAWGPVIQLVILNELDNESGNDFFVDGHYILAPSTVYSSPDGVPNDLQIQGMRFLADSLLFVYTSTQDIRVLYTQKFLEQAFQSAKTDPDKMLVKLQALSMIPQSVIVQTDGIEFDKIDSRLKMTKAGSTMTKEQCEIELERRNTLESPVKLSYYGPRTHQTIHAFQDRIILLTDQGLYNLFHLTWQSYLGHLEQTMQASWIDIFEKAIEFFNGRVKGFKGVVDDNTLRKDMIKGDLKELIVVHVDRVVRRWKEEAVKKKKAGASPEQVRDDLKDKLCTLIRMCIELCVEIWDPFFLFNELFQKFVQEEMSVQFAEEIKPYILSGVFSETAIPEAILNFHILQHHHNKFIENLSDYNAVNPLSNLSDTALNPAENFEKIIINLCFTGCSKTYKEDLIKFCREYFLSSGLIYLCLQTYDDQGPTIALTQLAEFFQLVQQKERNKEKDDSSPFYLPYTIKEIQELENMPANMSKRELLEKSSTYLGYKLLWAARLFLLGKKFPKGTFEMHIWNAVTHDVSDMITREEFIRTLVAIDAEVYFQTLSILFNNPSKQYTFLKEGRVKLEDSSVTITKTSMSHSIILERLHEFSMQLTPKNEIRLQYLFFVASIAKDVDLQQDKDFFYQVTLELIDHSKEFLMYNKLRLERQMTGKQLYRKLSRLGNDLPDHLKHYQVTEEHLEALLRKCEPLDKEQIDTLTGHMAETNFDSLKLILFEKQENYVQCVQLLVENHNSSFLNMKMQDGFAFILEKYFMLQRRIKQPKEETPQRYQFEMFEKEIFNRTHQLVRMDAHKTVGLADAMFDGNHNTLISKLNDAPKEQYQYISKLIELKSAEITETVQNYTLNRQEPTKSKQWMKILRTHLKLACQLAPDEVLKIVTNNIKQNIYPLEECLKTCQEFRQLEACALIQKKIGAYKDSIEMYLQLLDRELKIGEFRRELYTYDKQQREKYQRQREAVEAQRKKLLDEREEQERRRRESLTGKRDVDTFVRSQVNMQADMEEMVPMPAQAPTWTESLKKSIEFKVYCQQHAPNIQLFERILQKIENVCVAHPEELFQEGQNTWQLILQKLFKLAQDKDLARKRYCRSYLIRKMVSFVKKTLPFVKFKQMIESVLKMQDKIKWRSVRELVNEVFADVKAENTMCETADKLVQEECKSMEENMFGDKGTGLTFRSIKCHLCKRDVAQTSKESSFTTFVSGYRKDEDTLVLFECTRNPLFNHVYHQGCLKNFIGEELRKQDKKGGAGVKEKDIFKAFRCPECFQQKQSIDEQQQKMASMRPQAKKNRMTVVGGKKDEKKSSGTSSQGDAISDRQKDEGSRDDADKKRKVLPKHSIGDWRRERLLDRIKKFDQEDEFDSLTIDSFKKM